MISHDLWTKNRAQGGEQNLPAICGRGMLFGNQFSQPAPILKPVTAIEMGFHRRAGLTETTTALSDSCTQPAC